MKTETCPNICWWCFEDVEVRQPGWTWVKEPGSEHRMDFCSDICKRCWLNRDSFYVSGPKDNESRRFDKKLSDGLELLDDGDPGDHGVYGFHEISGRNGKAL